ncbi:MAG: hypothetical protein Q7T21_15560 [Gallionella sp.]|nr:hypothetical protein [Gallionella sp.]
MLLSAAAALGAYSRGALLALAAMAGEIVVTHLFTIDFPFVRYRTGGIGVLGSTLCSCGRGLPLLQDIQGRSIDFVLAADGTVMHGLSLIYILRDLPGVKSFQVVQETRALILCCWSLMRALLQTRWPKSSAGSRSGWRLMCPWWRPWNGILTAHGYAHGIAYRSPLAAVAAAYAELADAKVRGSAFKACQVTWLVLFMLWISYPGWPGLMRQAITNSGKRS